MVTLISLVVRVRGKSLRMARALGRVTMKKSK